MFESVFFSQWKGKDHPIVDSFDTGNYSLIDHSCTRVAIKLNQFDIYACYYYESQNFINGKTH